MKADDQAAAVLSMLDDPVHTVRHAAAQALGTVGNQQMLAEIHRYVEKYEAKREDLREGQAAWYMLFLLNDSIAKIEKRSP
ncbi:HEAT repeat domain-containing protein [Anatilimnocola sp. NA78]|uniref:HEAT repeat domain-containing protein n=1 Tax=Anatilimnocola sp. NA78 TaxID=3415683 RepID=UPI003CE4C6DF